MTFMYEVEVKGKQNKMSKRMIQAQASNLLCLLSTCSIVQPYSFQPMLQIDVPLYEYVILVKSMCKTNMMFYDSIFTLSQYQMLLDDYERQIKKSALIVFTFDMFKVCVGELKRAVTRGKDATVITLNYGDILDDVDCCSFDNMPSMLNTVFTSEGNDHVLFNHVVTEINRTYNTLPVDFGHLSQHNQKYYCYVALLRYRLAYAAKGNVFKPFNVSL